MRDTPSLPPTVGEMPVPFSRVAGFVRQVTHDVRNSLNGMDLQAAFVAELVTDPETQAELRRVRTMITQAAKSLQTLSANFWTSAPNPITYEAAMLVEDFRDRFAKAFPEEAPDVPWTVELGREKISIDIEMIFGAFMELLRNSLGFREPGAKVAAAAAIRDGSFCLEIREDKALLGSDPAEWGRDPFVSTRRGGYGLGVFRVRGLLALHGGALEYTHDPERKELTTRVRLPLASEP